MKNTPKQIIDRKHRRRVSKQYKKCEILMENALKWVTCPLGDVNGHIQKFERFLEYNVEQSIKEHFEKIYTEKMEVLMNAYHQEDENGFSAYDMDMAMMNGTCN